MTKRKTKENKDKPCGQCEMLRFRLGDLSEQIDSDQKKIKELTTAAAAAEKRRVEAEGECYRARTATKDAEARCDDLRGTIVDLERQLSRALGYIDRVTESDIPRKRTIEETPPVRGPQRDRFEIEAVRAGLVPDPFATTTHSKTWWRR